mgnify:CR=1 FL=1
MEEEIFYQPKAIDNLKNNYLKFAIILMVLYWTGPLQLLLRFLLGGPFISETSVGGRFGVYIYITLLGLSIFAITKNIDKFQKKIENLNTIQILRDNLKIEAMVKIDE